MPNFFLPPSFFLGFTLLVLSAGHAPGQEPSNTHEWPQYRGNPGCTGVSPDNSVKPPLKLVWSYRLDGDASSDAGAGVTVAAGKVFVNVANTKSILALNAHTGRFEWEYRDSYVGYRTVAAYSDGRLILWERQLKKHAILALDAATGKALWQQPLKADQGFVYPFTVQDVLSVQDDAGALGLAQELRPVSSSRVAGRTGQHADDPHKDGVPDDRRVLQRVFSTVGEDRGEGQISAL